MYLKCIASSSKGNGYAVIGNKEILLLECGCSMKMVKKVIDWQISKVSGVLLSHAHGDHAKYLKDFLKCGITVYTNNETAYGSEIMCGEKLKAVPEFHPFKVGGFTVTAFYVPHNETPCFAYLIQHDEMGTLLFATDFEYLPWTFKQYRINHLLIECNYDMQFVDQGLPNYEHKLLGHASLNTCKGVIEKNKSSELQNVVLCHLGSSTSDNEYFIREVQKVAGNNVCVDVATSELFIDLKTFHSEEENRC